MPGASWHADPFAAAHDADLVVILTEWEDFKTLDLHQLASAMRTPRIADLRNLYDPDAIEAAGFEGHCAIGRAAMLPESAGSKAALKVAS